MDRDSAHRIWMEVGWIDDREDKKEAMDLLLGASRSLVAEVDAAAECLAVSTEGTLNYLDETLPFTGVTAVSTSRVVRKQGLAKELTARLVAEDARAGALVSGLGMFEQGFYNNLGFGTGSYEHWMAFDPAELTVAFEARVPKRLTVDDWEAVHASRLARLSVHGGLNFLPPEITRSEMMHTKGGFGLGFFDGPEGELTHHLWMGGSDTEHGPYSVWWMSYQTGDQLLELMALLRGLGDQVRLVWMREPPNVQLQDFLKQPFRFRQLTEKSKFENRMNASAYWQMRINDVLGCISRTYLRCKTVRFNLQLTDPIEQYLDKGEPWRGVGGRYVVTLGPQSIARTGSEYGIPVLKASVNAFTRLWLGVQRASGLAITDYLSAPADLISQLDCCMCIPRPQPDWDY
ncbi:MAG: GNAT family N-acetyltransferase [Anaerolineae bacterium]|nr:GNAT family N-acetyltransferase [Anaerolineae bacterium]